MVAVCVNCLRIRFKWNCLVTGVRGLFIMLSRTLHVLWLVVRFERQGIHRNDTCVDFMITDRIQCLSLGEELAINCTHFSSIIMAYPSV